MAKTYLNDADMLKLIRRAISEDGVRGFSRLHNIDAGFVSCVAAGKKSLSPAVGQALGYGLVWRKK